MNTLVLGIILLIGAFTLFWMLLETVNSIKTRFTFKVIILLLVTSALLFTGTLMLIIYGAN